MDIDPAASAEHERLLAGLADLGLVLPGTLTQRYIRCGKRTCRCHADPPVPHGPYWTWTRKVNGKTVSALLTDDQARDYQPWLDNARRLREITTRLEQLGLIQVQNDPRSRKRRTDPAA